jgi:hypothetical protein
VSDPVPDTLAEELIGAVAVELQSLIHINQARYPSGRTATSRQLAEEQAQRVVPALLSWLSERGQLVPGGVEFRLNKPMVARLRRCAADTSPSWDGAVTIYPPEARDLIALIDRFGGDEHVRRRVVTTRSGPADAAPDNTEENDRG